MKKVCAAGMSVCAFACVLFMILATCTFAEDSHELGVQKRIAKQQKRINDGVVSGKLTAPEARVLQENLNYIKSEEQRLRKDGKLGKHKREKLQRMLDKNSSMISNKKQNQVRGIRP